MPVKATASEQKSKPWPALLRFLPGLAAGLFISRVAGEWLGLPNVWAAVALAVLLGAATAWALSRWPTFRTWPALIPLAYVLYPEPYPPLALQVGIATLISLGLNELAINGRLATRAEATNTATTRAIAAALAIGFFILYTLTLAPGVLAADSGELQVVAAQLGVAHPPGFPLYVVLAHLMTRLLPFVAPAYAVNLFSAVTSALTVAVVYLAAAAVTRRHLPALLAAVALGTATTFWSQATTANVRSLTALFAALILYALIRYRETARQGDRRAADRRLIIVALLMGFGMTHHISLLFLIAVGLVFIFAADPALLRSPRRWLWPMAAGLAGLLPLLYLPLRASAAVRGASPDLATWPGFLEHVLATGFRGDLFYYLAPADLFQRLRIMVNVLTFQFEYAILAAMLVGAVLLWRRDRPLAGLLGGVLALYIFVAATYRAPQTVEYMIPGYVAAALLLAVAAAWRPAMSGKFGRGASAGWALFLALLVLAGMRHFVSNRAASGREHEATSAGDFAAHLLTDAPADSVILAHWHWATPLWYLQEVEGRRPDVDVRFVFPEGEPYEATWERRAREAFADGRPAITTWIPAAPLADMPVPEPISEALLFPQESRMALPPGYEQVALPLGDAVEVLGYRLEQPDGALGMGEELVLTVAWRAMAGMRPETGLFVHLIGADGVLYGQDDRPATAAEGITLTQFRATLRPGAPAGLLQVLFGATGNEPSRELLTTLEAIPASHAPFSQNRLWRRQVDDMAVALVGYDWDHTLPGRPRLYLHWRVGRGGYQTQVVDDVDVLNLPPYAGPWGVAVQSWQFPGREGEHYVPLGQGIVWTGETLDGLSLAPGESTVVDVNLHSSRPINRDHVVSARLIGLEPDGYSWAWWHLQDSIPAMGAIPTLKWVNGSFVRSPHRVRVAEDAPAGQSLTGALTFYDAFTNRPLPILDERMTAVNPWIPLGAAVVE